MAYGTLKSAALSALVFFISITAKGGFAGAQSVTDFNWTAVRQNFTTFSNIRYPFVLSVDSFDELIMGFLLQ